MTSVNLDSLSENQKLKVTVLCDVKKICKEVGSRLTDQVLFDKDAVELISEMVWKKIQDYGADLELFARHAKRSTINAEDVKLLVRKNVSLKEHITTMADESTSKRKRKDREIDGPTDPSAGTTADAVDADVDDIVGNFDIDDDFDMDENTN